MYKIHIENDVHSFQLANELSYLCILNVQSIPPHISFICNGLYFSFSVFGVKLATDAQARVDVFSKKQIPTVFVTLGSIFNELEVKQVYSKYKELKTNASCLDPLKELFVRLGLENPPKSFYLFDLLEWLNNKRLIKGMHSMNCDELLNLDNDIVLQKYSQKEIDSQIIKVLNVKK